MLWPGTGFCCWIFSWVSILLVPHRLLRLTLPLCLLLHLLLILWRRWWRQVSETCYWFLLFCLSSLTFWSLHQSHLAPRCLPSLSCLTSARFLPSQCLNYSSQFKAAISNWLLPLLIQLSQSIWINTPGSIFNLQSAFILKEEPSPSSSGTCLFYYSLLTSFWHCLDSHWHCIWIILPLSSWWSLLWYRIFSLCYLWVLLKVSFHPLS